MGEYYGLFTSNQSNKLNTLVKNGFCDVKLFTLYKETKELNVFNTEKRELYSQKNFFVTNYKANKLKCLSPAKDFPAY